MTYEFVEDGPKALSWDAYARIVQREWRELLDRDGTGESDFHEFLERHPCIIPGCDAFTGAGGWDNPAGPVNGFVISEPLLPGISNRYPDFMWAPTDSQTQWVVLIEIEDPKKLWFTENGQQRAELTQALDQIAQWRAHLKKPENLLLFLRLYGIPTLRPIEFVFCLVVSIRKSCERACQQPTWPFTMAAPVRALFAQDYPGAGGGCAQVRRSSGLAFQGRNRSSAIPVRGLPPLRPHSSR